MLNFDIKNLLLIFVLADFIVTLSLKKRKASSFQDFNQLALLVKLGSWTDYDDRLSRVVFKTQ